MELVREATMNTAESLERLREAILGCPILEGAARHSLVELLESSGPFVLERCPWLLTPLQGVPESECFEETSKERDLLLNALKRLGASSPTEETLVARLFLSVHWKEIIDLHLVNKGEDEFTKRSPFVYTML